MGEGIMPVMELNKGEENGSWLWMIVLFALLFCGGNGYGNNNFAEMQRGFDTSSLESKMVSLGNGLADGFYAQNTTMLNGFSEVKASVVNGINEVNANVTQARFDAQQNACAVQNTIHQEAEATRALLTQNEMQRLRDELSATQMALNNANMTQTLVSEIRPCSKPAYLTCSPYATNSCNM